MFNNRPLFPGNNYIDQINKIQQVLGTPMERDTRFIKNEKARGFLNSLPIRPKVAWPKLFPNADQKALDLLDKLLTFDPLQRIDVETGLAHDYLTNYYDPADQPAAEKPFTFEMEFDKYPTNTLKEMLFNEAISFKMAKLTETSF